jgi:predicted alpha/beta hydrolase family esterase
MYGEGMSDSEDQVLVVPGLYNSGPGHWQTRWEKEFGFARVEQKDWDAPLCEDWVRTLNETVAAQCLPVVLVAHSLGCITIAKWAQNAAAAVSQKVKGALLVAPSDVERPEFPVGAVGFSPIPLTALPFRSIVVASTNDPYISPVRAEEVASSWSADFENIGAAGHITTVDGFGPWPQGIELLNRLRS